MVEPPRSTDAIPAYESWKFCPACGTSAKVTGVNPFRCHEASCGLTHYFSPNTAVGALIVDRAGAMLFIVRGRDPGKGLLGLPGGFVDPGETAEQSLVREIAEEINLKVMEFQYLASFPNEYAFRGIVSPVTDLFFTAKVDHFDQIRAKEGEISDWKFVPPDQIDATQLAFDTHRQALDVFLSDRNGMLRA